MSVIESHREFCRFHNANAFNSSKAVNDTIACTTGDIKMCKFNTSDTDYRDYLNSSVNLTGQGDQCAKAPLLLYARQSEYQHLTTVSVLSLDTCKQTEDCCVGVSSNLGENDHESFDTIGQTTVVQCIVWMFAVTALLGNLVVICHCSRQLIKRFKIMAVTEKVHHFLVLNLALSDFLMGIYVTMYGIVHKQYQHSYTNDDRFEWLASRLCTAMGVLSFCSGQMSLTILVLITTFRLFGVVRPFAGQRKSFKLAVTAITFSWLLWITYAIFPLLPREDIKDYFSNFVKIELLGCSRKDAMSRRYLSEVLHDVSHFIKTECGQDCAEQHSLNDNPKLKDLIDFGRKLSIIPSRDEPMYFGYYNEQSFCTAKYFVASNSVSIAFTLVVICYNLLSFIYISIAYFVMLRKTDHLVSPLRQMVCSCWVTESRDVRARKTSGQREQENLRMQVRIVIIVATDFFCWIPICTLSIYHLIKTSTFANPGCEFLRYVSDWRPKLSTMTVVLLPINSSLNPFIYSFRYWNVLRRKLVGFFKKESSSAIEMDNLERPIGQSTLHSGHQQPA